MRRLFLLLALGMLVLGCPGPRAPLVTQRATPPTTPQARVSRSAPGFRLSDADDEVVFGTARKVVSATALDAKDAKQLFARMPALAEERAKPFVLPDKTMPAPRPGKTVTEPFPPPIDRGPPPAVVAPSGPPKIERRAPEGAVAIAPQLSVTFDRAMDVASSPVRITPQPPGEWRWIGAKTIVFAPEKRFPMATEFKVEVPSANAQWTFATPAPKVVRWSPTGKSASREPVLLLDFDQEVDPTAIAKSVDVSGIPVRLATPREIEEAGVTPEDKTQVALKPAQALAAAKAYDVRLRAGTRGKEGPRATEKDQTSTFTTHGPLAIRKHDCGYDRCKPLDGFRIELSNRIALEAFDKSLVRVKPEPPALKVDAEGATLWVHGLTKGRTTYAVTIGSALRDVHGQTLGRDETLTFAVGTGDPRIFDGGEDMIVLDPSSPRGYPVYSVNEKVLRTRLYAVKPEDWSQYRAYARDRKRQTKPPGRVVFDHEIRPRAGDDELASTFVDLAPALVGSLGHALLVVEGTKDNRLLVWVQSTELAVQAFVEPDALTGWVTKLANGAPVERADVLLLGAGAAATDATGIARLALSDVPGTLVIARKGADSVFAADRAWSDTKIKIERPRDDVRWLVFDDRGMYKPGEEVHLKGWVRRAVLAKGGDVDRLPGPRGPVAYKVYDPRGAEIAKGETPLDGEDAFDLAFSLPKDANLGDARVELTLGSAHAIHSVPVQEFRRPEFEVKAQASNERHVVGAHATATVEGVYYAGGGLAHAKADWAVTRTPTSWSPPNHPDFHFGGADDRGWSDDEPRETKTLTFGGRTDARGRHRLRVDFDPVDPPSPMSLAFDASVEDVNRQRWHATTNMLVHPATEYVGLRVARRFVDAGQPIAIELLVADLDGNVVPHRQAAVRAVRLEMERKGAEWVEKEVDEQTCASATSCAFATKLPGRYKIVAEIADSGGRKNQSALVVWVTGGAPPRLRASEAERVRLVPEKNTYRPGETANVLVVSPFSPAEAVLTVRRNGIVKLERFTMKTALQTIAVKLEDGFVPNVELRVDLAAAKHASGSVPLKVLPESRRLFMKVAAREPRLEPGGKTSIDVDVVDARGRAVKDAEVALVVADEAVLALSRYRTPDPIEVFYTARGADVRELGMRDHVVTTSLDPTRLAAAADRDRDGIPDAMDKCPNEPETFNGFQDDDGCPDPARVVVESNDLVTKSNAQAIAVRKDFRPLALWSPRVTTDAKGHAAVPLSLPDSLTRYRVMAVASAGERMFGSAESSIIARLPLMARPSPPRFLRLGDRFELPIVVQNQTDAPLEVAVGVRAANAAIEGPAAKRTTVPANDRVEVRFPAATRGAGTARLQVGIAAGSFADAAQVDVPVYTPATTEDLATYGEIDKDAIAQAVRLPEGPVPGFGGISVTTSSTALSALTDAVLYLVKYPYECAEQIASRVMAIAALRDVLAAFSAPGLPPPDALVASMKDDLQRLARMQHGSGGWSFWSGDREPWPHLSIHVAHAFVRAKDKGYGFDEGVLSRAKEYLRAVERHVPAWYGDDAKRSVVAYSLYVRKRMGDPDPARARRLVSEAGGADKLPIEALGWIWPTLGADPEVRRVVANRLTETAEDAHFASGYHDAGWVLLHSERRADAILLEAMMGDEPRAAAIPKLVKGLLAHRKAGRWTSTQENAFVLLALDRYFATHEKVTPDFVARVWLGDRFAGEHAFKGRTTERSNVMLPLDLLGARSQADVVVAKSGPGRAYYRIGTTWAPEKLALPPVDRGFVVTRNYESAGAPDDVRRDALGTWRIKLGATVRVRLTMVATTRRHHVALVDPLPAGLEPLNPALAVVSPEPLDPSRHDPSYAWYEHENLQDDRVEAFASLLWEGVHEYTYTARATTPGTFAAGAPKAEEMYTPETYGRGSAERVIVAE